MATKHTDKCLQKAGDDEPIFVLRSTDKLAPVLVRLWADMARLNGCPMAKVGEAFDLARWMDDWQEEHGCKWPD